MLLVAKQHPQYSDHSIVDLQPLLSGLLQAFGGAAECCVSDGQHFLPSTVVQGIDMGRDKGF